MSRYGWIPDLPDHRDYVRAPRPRIGGLPPRVDLRSPNMPAVYDQGNLGSCTANGIAAAVEFERRKQSLADLMPSRLFIYYNERVMEHSVNSDSGAMIRDGIKSVAKQGVCAESEWPYDIGKFTHRPPPNCYADARKDRVVKYQRVVQSIEEMKACLADGFPIVGGFTVYGSFESASADGVIPMPGHGESVLGGHCVLIVGYDDATDRFIVRNSWGSGWGDHGYCYMPYEYWTNPELADDFWSVELLTA